jgi:hypothetical protein
MAATDSLPATPSPSPSRLERITPEELLAAIRADGEHEFVKPEDVARAFGGAAVPAPPAPSAAAEGVSASPHGGSDTPAKEASFTLMGDFTASELAGLRKRYGDSLISVRKIDPFGEKGMLPIGYAKQGFDAVASAVLDDTFDVDPDPSIKAMYDHNVEGMPEMRYAAQPYFLSVAGDALTDAQCETMRSRWKATDTQVAHAQETIKRARAGGAKAQLNVWQNLVADTRAAHYQDTVTRVDVYAIGYHILGGESLFVQSEMFTRAAQVLAAQMHREQPDAFASAPQIRFAWETRAGSGVMRVYASPSPYAGQAVRKRDDPATRLAAQLRRAQDALTEKMARLAILEKAEPALAETGDPDSDH